MSTDPSSALESTLSTDDLMEIDTSFLDAYRRGRSEPVQRAQARSTQRDGQQRQTHAREPNPYAEVEGSPPGAGGLPERDPSGERSQRGGSGGAATGARNETTPTPPTHETTAEPNPVQHDKTESVAEASAEEKNKHETPASLRLTDHQEAVQNTTTARGGPSGGSDDGTALPQSGFRLSGVKSQPHIKALPETIIGALREQLRSAAVRELGVADKAAHEFIQRLSQGTLVTAFLLAQLDQRIDADPATQQAVELFRSQNPLLGSMAVRLENLERLEVSRARVLDALRDELTQVRRTGAVVEQAVAYSIADRTENFLRGSHDIHDAPITHKSALFIRDRAREATKKQEQVDREREGRPIR